MESNPRYWLHRVVGLWLGVWLVIGCGQSPAAAVGQESSLASPLARNRLRLRLSAGEHHSLMIRPDGTVWAAGQNQCGQLGNGTTTRSSTPVQVQGLSGAVSVDGGECHSLAVRSGGTVWA